LLRVIGEGSYGEVWLARNAMREYRAVKVVYRASFDEDRPYEREWQGIGRYEPVSRSHASQVDLLHIGRNDELGYFYYVMELADHTGEGEVDPDHYIPKTLAWVLKDRGRLSATECLTITLALADALRHLHGHGLVHRDIKPANIVFVNGIAKLADIGLVTDSRATVIYVGSQGYIPPEGAGRPQADLYSLGKVIYEMATGRDRMEFPSYPEDFGRWPDRAPVLELVRLSQKACQPLPENRYVSAGDLHEAAVLVQAGKSKRLRMLERGWRWGVGVAVLAILVAAAAWAISTKRDRDRERYLRAAQRLPSASPQAGWFTEAWAALRGAASVRRESNLWSQAGAVLAGLDTQILLPATDVGADSVAFDRTGSKVLFNGAGRGPVKRWDERTGEWKVFARAGTNGPVWFAPDGVPCQVAYQGGGVFHVAELDPPRVIRTLRIADELLDQEPRLRMSVLSADASLFAAMLISTNAEVAGQDRFVVWEMVTGRRLFTETNVHTAVAFSPSNDCLATGDAEGRVLVRSLPELETVADFRQNRPAVFSLDFTRDAGQTVDAAHPWLLAAGDEGGNIAVYEIERRRTRAFCRGSHYQIRSVAFAPDGMTLASGGRAEVRFWDHATGRLLLTTGCNEAQTAMSFSLDGGKLAVGTSRLFGGYDASAVLRLIPARGVLSLRGLTAQSGRVRFSHDGKRLAALAHNWQLGIWNLESNRLEWVFETPRGYTADNAALRFSPDDRQFAFATGKQTVVWDLQSGRLLRSHKWPPGLCQDLWFDRTGRLMHFQWDAATDRRCRVRDLDASPDAPAVMEIAGFERGVKHFVLSDDGRRLVIVGVKDDKDGLGIRAFDPGSGRELSPVPTDGLVDRESFATDPEVRLISGWNSSITWQRVWDIENGALTGDRVWGYADAFSPEADLAARMSEYRSGVSVWRRDRPEPSATFGAGLRTPALPMFSNDGRYLAFGTEEGTVLVVDVPESVRRLNELGLGWQVPRR